MTQQMLTAAKNNFSHTHFVRLCLTSVISCPQEFSCLSTRQETVTIGTGITRACCCPSQQIQAHYWHWEHILLLWIAIKMTSSWWHHLSFEDRLKPCLSSRKWVICDAYLSTDINSWYHRAWRLWRHEITCFFLRFRVIVTHVLVMV